MNNRIRYVKDSNGNIITQNYIKNEAGEQFRAGFVGGDPKSTTNGFVKSVDDDTTNITLKATSHWKIKIKIKKALAALGCLFQKEKRNVKVDNKEEI